MTRVPTTATAPSTPSEQSIAASFHVEVMNDLDTGQPTLIASTQPNHGDLQVVTAEQVRRKAAEASAAIAQGVELANAFEAATATAAGDEPRTWTTMSPFSGETITVTCMTGCRLDHEGDIASPTAHEDIYCLTETNRSAATVPVDPNVGERENNHILSSYIEVRPFCTEIAERLPHAVVEITDEHYIAPLDPDALAGLIDLLTSRVGALRAVHAELVHARAEYVVRRGVQS